MNVGAEGLHILAYEDSVLLGLIPVGLETSRKSSTKSSKIVEGLIGSSSWDDWGGGGWVDVRGGGGWEEACPASP